MLRKDIEYSDLRKYLDERYGSLDNAALILGINRNKLYYGVVTPKNGYKLAEQMIQEVKDMKQRLEYQTAEYERLARAYNDLVDKIEREQTLSEERI